MELILIRHGEVNRLGKGEGSVGGYFDPPLSTQGKISAKKVAEQLGQENDLAALYTSPLLRARETASIIAKQIGLQPEVIEDLREWDFFQKMGTLDRIQLMAINLLINFAPFRALLWIRWTRSPSLQDFVNKVSNAVQVIIASNPDKRVVIVAHGGTIDGLLTHFFPDPNQWERGMIKNCSMTRLRVTKERLELLSFNKVDHLQ